MVEALTNIIDYDRYAMTNDAINIARGCYPTATSINKFGRNSASASGAAEEVWDGEAVYVFPATALMTKISQTVDQSLMRGGLIEVQGLNSAWELVTQTKALNASLTTTPVTLDTPLIRVFRMRVLANVVGDSPIRLHNDAENQDYAIINVGNNQTMMAIYTVPLGVSAYMSSYWAHHNPTSGQTFTSCPIKLWTVDNANSYARQLTHLIGIAPDGAFQHQFYPYHKFIAQTDIYLTASPVAAAADISAGFDLILVDD